MFSEQDAKKRYAKFAEEAFQAAKGMSRDEWVRAQMMSGTDPKVAEAESRRLMAQIMDDVKDHGAEVARRYQAMASKK